ncbi:hypothetical protein L841_2370 [Mycobacterium sp. MAC_080597_8934]|nr:hypothetical protein L841_2370 [Mycobacterium sp. MAC_080597_8934]
MRAGWANAAAAITVVVAACPCPTGSADSTPDSPPFPIGQLGVPVHARAASGATADITVNSATWLPPGCTSHFATPTAGSACNVVELTITATSHRFFQVNQRYMFAGYGGGNQPWTHPDDAPQPATMAVDYQRLGKMPRCRRAAFTTGRPHMDSSASRCRRAVTCTSRSTIPSNPLRTPKRAGSCTPEPAAPRGAECDPV